MKLFLKTKDYAVTGEEFSLLQHETLEMLVTEPQPKVSDKYYDSKNYISHTDAKRNLSERLYYYVKKFTLWQKVSFVNSLFNSKRTLLDVGAGTGDFLVKARRADWQVNGVEPNRIARGRASEKKLDLSLNLESLTGKKFEVITLWHVLEHLPDLDNQIKTLRSLLEEEGTLVIAVPNYKSYDARHYQNFWAAYDVPRHLWHFSKTGLTQLIAKYEMKVVKIKPMIFDAFYVSLLSEKYRTGHTNFVKGFYRGLRSNIAAWRTKEYSSLIYVIKKT